LIDFEAQRGADAGLDDPRDTRPAHSAKGPSPGAPTPGAPPLREESSVRRSDRRPASYAVLDAVQRSRAHEGDVQGLVDLAQAGDDLAFAELYVMFFDRVHRYLLVAVENDDDAQELAQEVFARLVANLPSYDPARGAFCDWLFAAVRNRALDHLRTVGRAETVDPATIARYMPSVAERASALSDRFDSSIDVGSMIDGLPDAQRRVIALRFVFDLNAVEIADVVGASPDAVRHTQQRALKSIAAQLDSRSAAGTAA
jgi:RNA polymerase sigma factor (sigma-70 family)